MALHTTRFAARALTAATAQTLVQVLAPATKRLRIVEFSISFDGVTAAAIPVAVDLLRQSTAGTASAGTVVPLDEAEPTAGATTSISFSVEPTAGAIAASWVVPAYNGLLDIAFGIDREPKVAASGRFAIRATAPAGVNATGFITWDE